MTERMSREPPRAGGAVALLFVLCLLSPIADAGSSGAGAAEPVEVWVSILPQAFFVERIGGEHVRVEVMVGPGESPASYDPPARQLARLQGARLFFTIGVPMEASLVPRVRSNFPEVEIVDTTAGMDLDRYGEEGRSEAEDDRQAASRRGNDPDHHDGADHGRRQDPHVWLSPRLARILAENVAIALVRVDPDRKAVFRSNQEALLADLAAVDEKITGILQPVAGKELFVFHPAFGYFAAEYGLRQVAIEQGGLAPSPRHLAAVLDRMAAAKVRAVFVQPQFSASSARALAREAKVELVVLDPLARDYLNNLGAMAEAIREGLTGE